MRHIGPPIYIGFDTPIRKRRKFNWWGFNGLFLFLISFGVLSPLSLLISLIGLRQRPRKLAIAGTLLSLIGVSIMSLAIGLEVSDAVGRKKHAFHRHQALINQGKVEQTKTLLALANGDFVDYRAENEGLLPDAIDGNVLVIKYNDPWEQSLRYEINGDTALLRSAGPDSEFDTVDDITLGLEGQVDDRPLLPVN
jgi:hypothetical protein